MKKMQSLVLYLILTVHVFIVKAQVTENIYLHTDKSVYHAGEIIWLRADVVNGKSAIPLNISKVAYVELVNPSGKPVLQCKLGIKDALGKGFLDVPQNVNSGKYILRAYTNWMKNFSADYYFGKEITIVNINDSVKVAPASKLLPSLSASLQPKYLAIVAGTDKNTYRTRDKITLDISTSSPAKLSLSVYKIDSLQHLDTTSINNYLSHSLTQLPAGKPRFAFPPEYYGHIIEGKIINAKNGEPAQGITGYISVPGLKQFFQTAVSDSAGNIFFDMKDFYGVNEIVLQTNSINDSNYVIELKSPFSSEYARSVRDSFDISVVGNRDRVQHGISAQVQQTYFPEQRNKYLFPALDTSAFFGQPEANYNVDEYTKFASVEDILREYVTEVGVQKRDGKPYPFVFDQLRRKPFSNGPLILVNDMPVFNVERFMSMDPAVVKKIKVVNWKYFRGENSFDGIVSVTTKNESIEDFDLESNAVVLNYEGLQAERQFYSPVYENDEQRNSRIPDFRNVLYWAPEISTAGQNKKITFYSSDLKGDYAVVIQGISDNGESGSKTLIINIQ